VAAPQLGPRTTALTIAALELFEGQVEIISDEVLSHPANARRIEQYYAGAKLDWDIIAAAADIARDQQGELLALASLKSDAMRFLCVVAEPGAGKSTVAWRVAAELHKRQEALILHIKEGGDSENIWFRMPEFCDKVAQPIVVLTDDIFQDEGAMGALQQLNPWLRVTVIATSRKNEFRARRLKCEMNRIDLRPPLPQEKQRVLEKLGKKESDLSQEQQLRFRAADQFLVLMMELTNGKELREIVRDSIERLESIDQSAYHAYEYLCFTYQYSIAMPISLLERLDSAGRFHNLLHRDSAEGLIFSSGLQNVRVAHAAIAQTAADFYAERHSPAVLLAKIADSINVDDRRERTFLARLLLALGRAKSPVAMGLSSGVESAIARCIQNAIHITDLGVWRAFERSRGHEESAEKCANKALDIEPLSAADCNHLVSLYRERGQERGALPAVAKWCRDHPNQGGARAAYLRLIERYASKAAIEAELQKTLAWLEGQPHDNYVRPAFLGVVERNGTPFQIKTALEKTSAWLNEPEHQSDDNVRPAYLRFVERNGERKQIEDALKQAETWLASPDHENDSNVRATYLDIVGSRGKSTQIEDALKQTEDWLAKPEHKDDSNVRVAWLGLVETHGSTKLKESAISTTMAWLLEHSFSREVWTQLLAWLFRAGRTDEALQLAERALEHHPNDQNVLTQYVRTVQDTADEKTTREFYKRLITKHPKNPVARVNYAAWLREHDHHDEAKSLYETLVRDVPRSYQAHYGFGVLLLELECFVDAAKEFREVLRIHRRHQMAHDGLAWAAWKLGDVQKAEEEFKSAIYWSGIKGQPQAKFYTDLARLYVERGHWNDALDAFERAHEEDPDYFGNYWGMGQCLIGKRDYAAAADNLRLALKMVPDTSSEAREEISRLLDECGK
jgi:tetratricopeptide (TPR) repeat protein